ncbi:MAG: 4Fe-4S ferredoxin [Thermoprotei archaeon]|nr:MAG: 4Fe-4S ferredoxin [Thermoprotei archaeon]
MQPNEPPYRPIIFDPKVCDGCNKCVEVCTMNVLMPNPEKGKPPIVLYPDECWYGGCCVKECPKFEEGAIKLNFPLWYRPRWIRKETRESFRIGSPNPPPPNLKPPVGGWKPKP